MMVTTRRLRFIQRNEKMKRELLAVLRGSTPSVLISCVALRRRNTTTRHAQSKWQAPKNSNLKTLHDLESSLIAIGETSGKVLIWDLKEKVLAESEDGIQHIPDTFEDLLREDHDPMVVLPHGLKGDPVLSVCFGNRSAERFCSASCGSVKLWNIYACRDGVQDDGGLYFNSGVVVDNGSVIIGEDVGTVSFVKFSNDDRLLCIGLEESIMIYNVEEGQVILRLDGHVSSVTEVYFLEQLSNCIISISEDRTFKIWDIFERKVLYRSAVISPYAIVSVCEQHDLNRFVLGFSNGLIQVYETKQDGDTRCLWVKLIHEFDVNKKVKRFLKPEEKTPVPSFEIISSEPIWKQQHAFLQKQFENVEPEVDACEQTYSAIKLNFFTKNDQDYMMLCTRTLAIDMNLSSYEVENTNDIANVTEQCQDLFHSFDCQQVGQCSTRLVAASALKPFVYLMDINHQAIELALDVTSPASEKKENTLMCITASDELPNYLKAPLIRAESTQKKPNPKGLKDKPTTFSNKVKSSGYSEAPYIPKKKAVTTSSIKKKSPVLEPSIKGAISGPPTQLTGDTKLHSSPIMSLSLSPSKETMVTGSNSGLMLLSKFPISSKVKGLPLEKHSNSITAMNWSTNSKLLITSSSDQTATLWKFGKEGPEALFTMNKVLDNIKKSTDSKKPDPTFKTSVNNACFYHQDKFNVLTSSNRMYIYKYYVHKKSNSDERFLKKQVENHKYKLAHTFDSKQAQKITALACPNSFASNYILLGYSSKSLEIYDICKDVIVRSVEMAHERPIHSITLNTSPNATSDSVNLFLTSSIDGCIKLWDIRQQDYVRRYSQHKNSMHTIGNDISPCMRYIASGSEDRCIYLYDLTTSERCVEKIVGAHTDVVSDVKFKSISTLVSCSFDGSVSIFSPSK